MMWFMSLFHLHTPSWQKRENITKTPFRHTRYVEQLKRIVKISDVGKCGLSADAGSLSEWPGQRRPQRIQQGTDFGALAYPQQSYKLLHRSEMASIGTSQTLKKHEIDEEELWASPNDSYSTRLYIRDLLTWQWQWQYHDSFSSRAGRDQRCKGANLDWTRGRRRSRPV